LVVSVGLFPDLAQNVLVVRRQFDGDGSLVFLELPTPLLIRAPLIVDVLWESKCQRSQISYDTPEGLFGCTYIRIGVPFVLTKPLEGSVLQEVDGDAAHDGGLLQDRRTRWVRSVKVRGPRMCPTTDSCNAEYKDKGSFAGWFAWPSPSIFECAGG
jgi:hypothetical protein